MFLLGAGQKNTVNTMVLPPEAKNIVNTVVLGFRCPKNIGIYGVFFCPESVKKRENTTYATIFRAHKNAKIRCVAQRQQQQQQQEEEEEKQEAQKCDQKDVLQAAV
jgi:ABC-type molybdate transport system permease subunit